MGEIIRLLKYGHLTVPGAFSDNIIPDIDFTDKVVVKRGVLVVKILL